MSEISIEWYNAAETGAINDAAEIDHPSYPETMCPWIEKLQNGSDGRWIYSVDIPDMRFLDENGYPTRVRSLANGIVYSREEALAAVEEAIKRIVGGPEAVS
ncbi:hypothetical protein [Rhizobium rhizogenes]|uniref:hypothetical protein n=1 Tax=Rhizobium rhizogenes TaxID=359 RepID=UPI001296D15D|nr:hypothetical protein [Rhizobium rhizogenes]